MMKQLIIAMAAAVLSLATPASADFIHIDVGNTNLLPNTPNQQVPIHVTGGQAVQGLDLVVQIADGGPAVGGTMVGPSLTAVDLITGTIFTGNNNGMYGPGVEAPQLAQISTSTQTGTVSANGLLATLTIDTTGFNSGTFPLLLTNTVAGSTDFADPALVPETTINNGTITITVPEPSIGLILAPGLLLRRTRRIGTAAGPTH